MRQFCYYTEVLGPSTNAAIYRAALDRRAAFAQSRIVKRGVDRRIRASTVLYDGQLADVAVIVRQAVIARLQDAVHELGIPEFDIGTFETQMTSHNDGEFFHRHTDTASPETASRMLTYVYYFHGKPKAYTGGELVFYDDDGHEEVLEPGNDTLVIFNPHTAHEVRPISCSSRLFENGRFTLNGWLHQRSTTRSRATFFDQKIFTPIRQWSAHPSRSLTKSYPVPSPMLLSGTGQGPQDSELRAMRALLILYGDLHRTSSSSNTVDVRRNLDGETFFAEYYARNRPVLLPTVLVDTEAVRTWSPEFLAEHYGQVPVQITSGRERYADYELRYRETVQTVTIKEFCERLAAHGKSNDFYLVARNNFFDNPQLSPLRDALEPPVSIINDADRRPGSSKVWMGPAGTVTPLHFDEHSILFAQVYGHKHVKVIPSFDYPFMYVHDRYYSAVDPERVDPRQHPHFADASIMDVIMRPGDCLFLPVGWWHWAKSLSVSISATFSSFARPWTNTRLANR